MSTITEQPRFALTRPHCSQCVKLQDEITRLRQENKSLQDKLRYQQRQSDEGYFGSSTSSSKKPFKANTKAERKNGGGRVGHRGYGRTSIDPREADEVIAVDTAHVCPQCQVVLESLDMRERTVTKVVPVQVQRVLYQLTRRRCPECRRVFSAKAPGVLPKFKQDNNVLAHVAIEHYLHQVTLGHLAQRLGINQSSLIEAMHHLAQLFKEVPQQLIAEYRQAPLKHADETTWRNDGRNGYAWIFCTPTLTIFRLRLTRAASVATEVFGEEALPGKLVVDRYCVYNKIRCALQYCYAHLLRLVQDLGKEFPQSQEVQDFVAAAAPLLAQAIKLRALPITDEAFYARAEQLKIEIQFVMHRAARHAGIQKIQNIFREHSSRLYPWAQDRSIPADNNFAERELRKLVIARKISFGSQADAGAKTRELLMTTLFTLKKRKPGDLWLNLKAGLDELAREPKQDADHVLFSSDSS